MTVKTVGLDLAMDVFQVHGISAAERRIFNKKIKRPKLLAFWRQGKSAVSAGTRKLKNGGSDEYGKGHRANLQQRPGDFARRRRKQFIPVPCR